MSQSMLTTEYAAGKYFKAQSILATECSAGQSKDSTDQSSLDAKCPVGQSKYYKAQSILATGCAAGQAENCKASLS